MPPLQGALRRLHRLPAGAPCRAFHRGAVGCGAGGDAGAADRQQLRGAVRRGGAWPVHGTEQWRSRGQLFHGIFKESNGGLEDQMLILMIWGRGWPL